MIHARTFTPEHTGTHQTPCQWPLTGGMPAYTMLLYRDTSNPFSHPFYRFHLRLQPNQPPSFWPKCGELRPGHPCMGCWLYRTSSIQNQNPTTPHLLSTGPFNPAATLPPMVVKKTLDLKFVEMSEIMMEDNLSNPPSHPLPPAHLPITNISQWAERFSIMAAILSFHFPSKAPLQNYGNTRRL